MSALERLRSLRESGLVLFPNPSEEDKRSLLYIEDEPVTSSGQTKKPDN